MEIKGTTKKLCGIWKGKWSSQKTISRGVTGTAANNAASICMTSQYNTYFLSVGMQDFFGD
jgi:hypothetical protein